MFTIPYKYTLSIVTTLVVASSLSAAQVATLTSFQANTTAKASEVNDNFTALKNATNDNDTRINAKQNRVSGACAAGYYVQSIEADGSVVCHLDINTDSGGDITEVTAGNGLSGGGSSGIVTLKRAAGSISISSAALQPTIDNTCNLNTGAAYSYFDSSSTSDSCYANAQVTLPDHATIVDMTCRVYKNESNTDRLYVELNQIVLSTGTNVNIISFNTLSNSTDLQTLTGAPVSNTIVDNSQSAYVLTFTPTNHTSTSGINSRFYNCTISYTY